MAISRTQNVSASTNTVAITAATAGDYIVVCAYNGSSNVIPTLPSGFTSLQTATSVSNGGRLGYKVATGGETSAGTWTNATHIACMVYSGVTAIGAIPIGGFGNSTSILYPAVTLQNATGSSWVAAFAGATAATAGMNGTPTGTAPNLGNRTSQTKVNALDTGTGVTSFSAQTLTYTTTGRWVSFTVELKAVSVFQQSFAATLLYIPGGTDFYSESNGNNTATFATGSNLAGGQTFTSQGGLLAQAKFHAKKIGTPTGFLFAYIIPTTGSPPFPSGSTLATSDPVDISTLSTTAALIAFNFSGAQRIQLTNGTVYAVVVDPTGTSPFNSSNTLVLTTDTLTLTDPGNAVFMNSLGVWGPATTSDIPYYVTYQAPSATLIRNVRKALAAVQSFVGAFSRSTQKAFAATLSFIGSFAKSFIAGGGHLFTQSLTATLSFVGAFSKGLLYLRSFFATLFPSSTPILWDSYNESNQNDSTSFGTGAGIPMLSQSFTSPGGPITAAKFYLWTDPGNTGNAYAKLFAHSGTFGTSSIPTGTALATSDPLDVSTMASGYLLWPFTFSGVNQYNTSPGNYEIVIDVSGLSSAIHSGRDTTSPTHSGNEAYYSGGWNAESSVDLCFYVYGAGASVGPSGGSLSLKTLKLFTATFSPIAALSRKVAKALTAALSFVGTFAQNFIHGGTAFTQSLAATLSFIGVFSEKNIITRAFTATLSASASLARSLSKAFSATLSTAASLVRSVTRSFSATLTSFGALLKAIRDAGFTATLSFVGNLTTVAVHFFIRAFTATLSFTGSLASSRFVQRVFTATLAFSAALRGRIAKVFAATLSFSTAARNTTRKVFAATLSLLGFFFKGGAITVLAGWITQCFATIGIGGSVATATRAGSQLTIVKVDESGVSIQTTGSTLTVERTK